MEAEPTDLERRAAARPRLPRDRTGVVAPGPPVDRWQLPALAGGRRRAGERASRG
ncbi:hypothetical protein [Streptomyces sp. NA13]|uniref:hypothetical protein n=1 Tax=Streptomyces sp. NA13 TaxID=2996051 RepID=UPI00226EB5FA|nr:hypothetical protein [Streptomyces sp. NA13]WAC94751.1 hypothetical protein OSU72_00765 [Streptomyces sp. NA13]